MNTRQGCSSQNKQERGAISDRAGPRHADDALGLLLLFPAGERPDADALQAIVTTVDETTVSHMPHAEDGAPNWLEVLADGLTFDVSGLAPDEAVQTPSFEHSPTALQSVLASGAEAIVIAPGPHLAGGLYLLPILRGLLSVGAVLGERLPGLRAYGWEPSNSLMDPDLFQSSTKAWADGGAFPASLLMRFKRAVDGGMHSVGLSAFIGQELRLEPDIAEREDIAQRLGERLIHQMVLRGRVDTVEEITGPEGNRLRMEPSKNGQFVRVWQG